MAFTKVFGPRDTALEKANPSAKAPRFARVGGGSFVVRSLPPAFCKEAVSTTRTRDLPITKEQPHPRLALPCLIAYQDKNTGQVEGLRE